MKTTYTNRNYHISDRLKGIVEKKLEKIKKYFDEGAACTVVCTKVGQIEKMEVTIVSRGHAFRAQEENRSMYSNIDLVMSKLERQIVKNKEKLRDVIRREAVEEKKYAYVGKKQTQSFVDAEVKKTKSFDARTLTNEEAELALATIDHDFFVYVNKDTGKINIMYRRDDGHVGVIEVGNARADARK